MAKRLHRGRPPQYVTDGNGRPVVGLSYDKANNFYFNTHWKTEKLKKQNFGQDKLEAIARFRIWQSEQEGKTTTLEGVQPGHIHVATTVTKKLSPAEREVLNQLRHDAGEPELSPSQELSFSISADSVEAFGEDDHIQQTYTLLEGLFWQKARELILEDIHRARNLLNLPIILDGQVLSEKSLPLAEIGQLYFDKRCQPMSKIYQRDSRRFWAEFCKFVPVKRVGEITAGMMDDYEGWVYTTAKQRHWSPASINNRLSLVRAVFRQAFRKVTNPSDIEHLKNVGEYCHRLTRAGRTLVNAQAIKKEDYLKILNITTDKTHRAILLLALNCGMKESGVIDVRIKPRPGQGKADIDLENKTLAMPRPKTGIIRVAVLWDRTVAAIQSMLEEQKNETEFLFVNTAGRPMTAANLRKWWARQREKAGVEASVKFEDIRDAVQTIPMEDDPKRLVEVALIQGHAVAGMANNYLERRPNMVRRACQLIEKHYFGGG